MAAPTTVLTIVKRFAYRGNGNEEFSNTYMLTGATPADSAAWRTLFDAVVAEEKKLYIGTTTVVRGYGYSRPPVKGDSAVWSVDMTVAPNTPVGGSGVFASTAILSGDTANWLRWGLDRLTSPGGKRIYLRKYFHPAYANSGTNMDDISPAWRTAALAFGAKMDDGTLAGGRRITDRLGTATVGHAVGPYTTTRTLKRRSKRAAT